MTNKSPTVFVVEDDDDMRESIERMVSTIGIAVEVFNSPVDFLEQFDPTDPGCLIFDIRLPSMSGMQLFETLRSQGHVSPVIFVTAYAETDLCVRAMHRGAWDFMEKPFSRGRLLDCINEAIAFDAARRVELAEREAIDSRIESLTPRESQVLNRMMEGHSTKEMAKLLSVSTKTVEGHRANVFLKMDTGSLPQLSLLMARHSELRNLSSRS